MLGCAATALLLLPLIGIEFFRPSDESQFIIRLRGPAGTRVEETERTVVRIENITRTTLKPGEYTSIVSSIGVPQGRAGLSSQNTGPHAAQVQVYLSPPDQRCRNDSDIVAAIRPRLAGQFPGTTYSVQLGGIVRRVLNFGAQAAIEVERLGYDLKDARALAREVARTVAETPGVADVFVSREEDYPRFDIVVDREKAASAGLSQRDIAQAALFSLASNVSVNPSIFTDPRTGNQIQYGRAARRALPVQPGGSGAPLRDRRGGRPVLLSSVARIAPGVGPAMIERKHQQRIVKISANPAGRDPGSLSEELEERLRALPPPLGFSLQPRGQTVQQREAFGSLRFAFILALILVYMVMAFRFRSLLDPFIIMFSVPLGMIGAIWALFLTGTTLNVTSFMGIIMMVGIVVSNGVLLVEDMNVLRRHGMGLREAAIRAGRTRLRPIVMTSLTILVGLFPMALGIDVGSEANAPLARAVIGGLAVSTVLTLLLIPTLYVMIEERFPRRLEAPAGSPALEGESV